MKKFFARVLLPQEILELQKDLQELKGNLSSVQEETKKIREEIEEIKLLFNSIKSELNNKIETINLCLDESAKDSNLAFQWIDYLNNTIKRDVSFNTSLPPIDGSPDNGKPN